MVSIEEAMRTATVRHQAGDLQAAEEIYRWVLAIDPERPEALHQLGLASLQHGDPAQAIALMTRAIDVAPRVSVYHSDLAEAYRTVGEFASAVRHAESALELDPTNSLASNVLGVALLSMGETAKAAHCFRTAIRLKPDFALAHNNLANAMLRDGDRFGAIEEFQRAIEIDPRLAAAHSNLGQILMEQGQPHRALAPCREAARLWPQSAEIQNNLGNVLRELGLLEEARTAYAETLRLAPNLAMAWSNMGKLLHEQGLLADAIACFRRAIELAPESALVQCAAAIVLFEQGKLDAAAHCYESAIRQEPDRAEAHNGLGRVRERQGRYDEAMVLFRRAVTLDPDFAEAHRNLGVALKDHGKHREAEESLRQALRLDPRHASALAELAMLLGAKTPSADLDSVRRLLADPGMKDAQRWPLAFGLAAVLDAQGRFAEAAVALQQANSLCHAERRRYGQGYDPAAHARFVDGMVDVCTPAFFERVAGFGLTTERPIFIFGLPRSGTSLVEQILASHSRIFGAGELDLAREDFAALAEPGDDESRALERLATIDRDGVQRLAERHLQRLDAIDGAAPHVTDKMPENYVFLGLLAVLFPRAKFIHCRRDLRDVALSCWMTNFLTTRWANDPADIVAHFSQYLRLMNHWRAVLPALILEVVYEDMVSDLEPAARRLVQWCGLDWEPACLEFHRSVRAVHTASSAQVRRPIYQTSVGRWRHYEDALAAFFHEIGLLESRNSVATLKSPTGIRPIRRTTRP